MEPNEHGLDDNFLTFGNKETANGLTKGTASGSLSQIR